MRKFRLLLFAFALLHGSLYAALMPPWQAPDEVAHFVYARLTADLGRLPVAAEAPPELETEILASLARHRAWDHRGEAAPQPLPTALNQTPFAYDLILQRRSLGYLPFVAAVWPLRSAPVEVQLMSMRLASVLIGALVVLTTFAMARLTLPRRPAVAAASALVVVLLPQHTFINASVNDGNLAALAATLSLYCLVRLARARFSWRLAIGAGGLAVFAILSKATAYFLIPLLVLAGAMLIWRRWPARGVRAAWRRLTVAAAALLALGALALLAAMYLPRLEYLRRMLTAGLQLWADFDTRSTALMADGLLLRVMGDTVRTFWGTFGWVVVWLPDGWYTLCFALTGLAVAGLAVQLWRTRRPGGRPGLAPVILGMAVLCAAGVLGAWFLASPDGLSYYQGRYLFGAIAPLATLLAAGWAALLPARAEPLVPVLVTVVLAVLDVAALLGVALPYFYRV